MFDVTLKANFQYHSQSVDTNNTIHWDQRKNVYIAQMSLKYMPNIISTNSTTETYLRYNNRWILIISICFRKTMIIRSTSDELEEWIWYGPDNPCRVKKILIIFLIGNFTILTQLCDFFIVFLPLFLILIIILSVISQF